MKLPCASLLCGCLLAADASCSCSRQIELEPTRPLLEHRVVECERWCEVRSSECGPSGDDIKLLSADECVEECASADGSFSWQWGYREEAQDDECIDEWKVHATCLLALSCEDQQTYWLPTEVAPPLDERRCYSERRTRDICALQEN